MYQIDYIIMLRNILASLKLTRPLQNGWQRDKNPFLWGSQLFFKGGYRQNYLGSFRATLLEINISHLGKRKIIFKYALSGGYVNSLEGKCSEHLCWVIYIFQKHPHVNASNQREANQPAKPNLLLMAKMLHQFIGTFFTLQGINISHLGKRKIIFKMPFLGDMLVSWGTPLFTGFYASYHRIPHRNFSRSFLESPRGKKEPKRLLTGCTQSVPPHQKKGREISRRLCLEKSRSC